MYFEDELANSKRTWGSQGKCGSDEVYDLTLSCEFILRLSIFFIHRKHTVKYHKTVYLVYHTESQYMQYIGLPWQSSG